LDENEMLYNVSLRAQTADDFISSAYQACLNYDITTVDFALDYVEGMMQDLCDYMTPSFIDLLDIYDY
jgi:hypothetical protein